MSLQPVQSGKQPEKPEHIPQQPRPQALLHLHDCPVAAAARNTCAHTDKNTFDCAICQVREHDEATRTGWLETLCICELHNPHPRLSTPAGRHKMDEAVRRSGAKELVALSWARATIKSLAQIMDATLERVLQARISGRDTITDYDLLVINEAGGLMRRIMPHMLGTQGDFWIDDEEITVNVPIDRAPQTEQGDHLSADEQRREARQAWHDYEDFELRVETDLELIRSELEGDQSLFYKAHPEIWAVDRSKVHEKYLQQISSEAERAAMTVMLKQQLLRPQRVGDQQQHQQPSPFVVNGSTPYPTTAAAPAPVTTTRERQQDLPPQPKAKALTPQPDPKTQQQPNVKASRVPSGYCQQPQQQSKASNPHVASDPLPKPAASGTTAPKKNTHAQQEARQYGWITNGARGYRGPIQTGAPSPLTSSALGYPGPRPITPVPWVAQEPFQRVDSLVTGFYSPPKPIIVAEPTPPGPRRGQRPAPSRTPSAVPYHEGPWGNVVMTYPMHNSPRGPPGLASPAPASMPPLGPEPVTQDDVQRYQRLCEMVSKLEQEVMLLSQILGEAGRYLTEISAVSKHDTTRDGRFAAAKPNPPSDTVPSPAGKGDGASMPEMAAGSRVLDPNKSSETNDVRMKGADDAHQDENKGKGKGKGSIPSFCLPPQSESALMRYPYFQDIPAPSHVEAQRPKVSEVLGKKPLTRNVDDNDYLASATPSSSYDFGRATTTGSAKDRAAPPPPPEAQEVKVSQPSCEELFPDDIYCATPTSEFDIPQRDSMFPRPSEPAQSVPQDRKPSHRGVRGGSPRRSEDEPRQEVKTPQTRTSDPSNEEHSPPHDDYLDSITPSSSYDFGRATSGNNMNAPSPIEGAPRQQQDNAALHPRPVSWDDVTEMDFNNVFPSVADLRRLPPPDDAGSESTWMDVDMEESDASFGSSDDF